ncbi:MAG: hypothetical protein JW885_10625 [Deltaproteobacteria bacterium]|nr:hypothetical protein [Candidatus Zymogenaceae bacterium]
MEGKRTYYIFRALIVGMLLAGAVALSGCVSVGCGYGQRFGDHSVGIDGCMTPMGPHLGGGYRYHGPGYVIDVGL